MNKYIELMTLFFSFVKSGKVKVRIMFRNNNDTPSNDDVSTADDKYFKLYYQFIKNAFGFRTLKGNEKVYVRIYLDQLPDKKGAESVQNSVLPPDRTVLFFTVLSGDSTPEYCYIPFVAFFALVQVTGSKSAESACLLRLSDKHPHNRCTLRSYPPLRPRMQSSPQGTAEPGLSTPARASRV